MDKKTQVREYVYDLRNASEEQKANVKSYLHDFVERNFDKMSKVVKREETHINIVHERSADIQEKAYVVGMVERFDFYFGMTDEV